MASIPSEPRYTVKDPAPGFGQMIANFKLNDIGMIGLFTAASVSVGYMGGKPVQIRGPTMVMAGTLGLVGGFLFACQNSAGRLMGFRAP